MNKKRIWVLVLALTLLLGTLTPAFATETAESVPTEETQPEQTQPEENFQTIYIQTPEDLLDLAEKCRLDSWSRDKKVVLKNNLSLEGADFQPIPSFGGIFDGNGCTISGVYLDDSVTPCGLFGQIQTTGIVRDLTVSGDVIPAGDAKFVGGIAGENHGTISNCTFTGAIVGDESAGGIAGVNALTGKITGCEASGMVIGMDMTGGVAGCNLGIIAGSVNKTYVNTVSSDPTIDTEDLSLDFLSDTSKLVALDTSVAAMDTGGIAGYSSGILESCTNKTAVGYPHVGYNVGGIVGRSCGYIHNCENVGEIYGRKDVGGIAGQMEPYIAQNITESTLAKLERQLKELDDLMGQTMTHAEGASTTLTNRLNGIANAVSAAGSAAQDIRTTGTITGSITGSGESGGGGSVTVTPPQAEVSGSTGAGGSVSVEAAPGSGSVEVQTGVGSEISAGLTESGVSGEGGGSASVSADAQTQIDISTNLSGLASSLYGMAGQMRLLSGELGGATSDLMGDVEQIRAKISEITETGFSLILGDGDGDVIVDSSDLDIDTVTLGKTSGCTNSGAVDGDLNVGGIAGSMAMEYELDPEDDVSVSIDGSQRRKYEVKAVIHRCENLGAVNAKRHYAGGITGKMDLGLIANCESYGSVTSEGGNYIGGIAGLAGSTVRHCFVKCSLSGGKYVGGIVGSGVQEDHSGESSTVAGCYAIVTIPEYKQYAGAISGDNAGTFLENYFVSGELAGINRMSYAGQAEPVSYDELIAAFDAAEADGDLPALPEEFEKFTLKFVIDGEVVDTRLFVYGASFDDTVFPALPQKEGRYACWDRTDLENLTFDTVVTAVYTPYISSLASTDLRGTSPIFFAEGNFSEGDELETEELSVEAGGFEIPGSLGQILADGLTHGKAATEVVEQWRITVAQDDLGNHTLRYLPPDGATDGIEIYLRQTDGWEKAETEMRGSYVTFWMETGTNEIAVVETVSLWWLWLIPAALVLAVLILVFRRIHRRVQRKKAMQPPAEETDETQEKEVILRVPPQIKPRKHRRWLVPLLVALALLVGILGSAAFFLLPDLMNGKAAYDLLKEYAQKEELSMALRVDADLGGSSVDFTADVDRILRDGQSVTVISQDGKELYYTDGVVLLENGVAFRVGSGFPDYSQLLDQTVELYRRAEITREEDCYSITVEGADVKAILELLLPDAASDLSSAEHLEVRLNRNGEDLESMTFSGSGTLNDRGRTAYRVHAVLETVEKTEDVQIPQAVLDTLNGGEYSDLEELTENALRLVNGWENLEQAELLAADLTLNADCGPLNLNETLELYRWNRENAPIYSIQQNGYGLYFSEDAVCDSNGNSVPKGSTANRDAAELLDLAYEICMNAEVECINKGSWHTYRVTLDEDGMAAMAYAIAPEAAKMNISFGSGELMVAMQGEQIESISVNIRGNVQIVLSSAEVQIGAKLEFTDETATLPDAVAKALG